MKVLLLIAVLFFYHSRSFGQQNIAVSATFKISGKVIDTVLKQPVEYTTVTVTSNKGVIENKIDKIVFNVDNDSS